MTGCSPSGGIGDHDLFTGHGQLSDGNWTDDQLSALLAAIRRHIHAAPPGTWDSETLHAAKTVTAALSARLAGSEDRRPAGGT